MHCLLCAILLLSDRFNWSWETFRGLCIYCMSYFHFIVSLLIQKELISCLQSARQNKRENREAGWFESWVLAAVFHFVCWQSHRSLMQEWPGLDPHFLFILWSQGLPPVQHPREIPCTLFSTNPPGRHRKTSSKRPFQVNMWKETDGWHALHQEYWDQRCF